MTEAATGRPGTVAGAGRLRPRRTETGRERRADAAVHLVGLVLGGAGCVVLALVAVESGDPAVRLSLAVYGFGLAAMLTASAVYNTGVDVRRDALWRRLDHAMIFVMIAGTYTPFAVLAIGGDWGRGILVFVWSVAAIGVLLKLLHPRRLEAVSLVAYLGLGWTVVVVLDRVVAALSTGVLTLLIGGGLVYSAGVPFYRWRSLAYHRAIWHGFVLVAAAMQYAAILALTVRGQ